MAKKAATDGVAGKIKAALQPSWLRKVIPQGYATATLHIEGTSPFLMNSPDADRDGELYQAFVALSQKLRKTQDDEARLRELEWELRIYLDDEIGPYIPGRMVKKCLVDAAGKWRKGATLKRSLTTVLYRIPLEYDGPRDQQSLWDGGYRYTTMVQNAGFGSGRVMRCRPMFPEWAITADVAFDPEEVDPITLGLIVERSQRYGLGDYRPDLGGDFGAFTATLDLRGTTRAHREPMGAKERNGHAEQAHAASVARLMEETEPVGSST